MVYEKRSFSITFSVMAVFFVSMCLGAITPVIAKLMSVYPDVPPATITYVMSIPSLVAIPAAIITGKLAGKKIKYKTITIICILLFIIGGCAPTFLSGFKTLLVTRAIFGIGMGGLTVLGNPLVTSFYAKEKRANILGISTFVAFGGSMVMQYIGGFLADVKWNYVFLTHAVAIIALILVMFFLPEPDLKEDANQEVQNKKDKIPGKALAVAILFSFSGMLITPLLFNSSVLVSEMSSLTTIAATVSVFYSLGCMTGGIIFGKLYQITNRFSLAISMLMTAVGITGVVLSTNVVMMCISMVVAGIGYCSAMPAVLMIIGLVTPKRSVAFATSILFALMNFMSFFATPWMSIIAKITGDAIVAPIVVAIFGFAILGIMLLFVNLFPKEEIQT